MAICSECGMHFHNKSNLNRHMKAMHAQAAQDEESEDDVEDDADVESIVEEDEPASDNEQPSSDEEEVDVWKVITNEADDDDGGVLESFKRNVMFCRALKLDETYQAVINTLEKAKVDEEMGFAEALDYAVDKRKFLINRSANEADQVQREEEEGEAGGQ